MKATFLVRSLAVFLLLILETVPASSGQPREGTPPGTNWLTTFKTVSEIGIPPFIKDLPSFQPPPLPPGSAEERPATEDPGGHWGCITEGFQFSLRLATNRFVVGQAVTAYVILRNSSGTDLHYTQYGGIHARFCNFSLWDWAQKEADAPHRPPPTLTPLSVLVERGSQHRTWARLDKVFDLQKPGRYSVLALGSVPLLNRTGHTIVVSGAVEFEILPSAQAK